MKVWIGIDNKPFEASGYKIISPMDGQNPLDIATLLDDNECDEIILCEVLSYIPYIKINDYLRLLVSKLRHKGKLVISNTDAVEVNKAYYNSSLTLEQYNHLLFGGKTHAWDFRQSIPSLYEVVNLLKSCGLKILHKRLPRLSFSISAERP